MNRYKALPAKIFTLNRSNHTWLIILRIGSAMALIAKILSEFPYINDLYGSDGLVPHSISHFSQNAYIPSLQNIFHLMGNLFTEHQFLIAFFLCQLVFAMFLLLGFATRFFAIICWLMQIIVFNSTHLTSYGFDTILLSLLFYSMIFPAGRYLSIDGLKKPMPEKDSMVPVYQKIIQVHICLIYFVNGWSKLGGHSWQDGSGMWDAINQPQFRSCLTPLLQKIFMIGGLPAIITWLSVLIEIAYPFLVWVRGVNKIMLTAIILLHVFIALIFGLWLFAFVMIVFNLSAFGGILFNKQKTF